MGKSAAHAFVERACKAALTEKIHLRTYFLEKTDILSHITEGGLFELKIKNSELKEVSNEWKPTFIDSLFDAKNAIGLSSKFVEKIVAQLTTNA